MSNCKQFHGKPIKCNAYKGSEETDDEGTVCQYTAATVKGKIGQCRKLRRGADHEKAKESARRRDKLEKLFQEDAALMVQKKYKAKKFKKVKSQFLDLSKDLAEQKKQEEEAEIAVRKAEEVLRQAKEREAAIEKARIAQEEEDARLAKQEEDARLAKQEEDARLAKEKKRAEKKARIAKEKAEKAAKAEAERKKAEEELKKAEEQKKKIEDVNKALDKCLAEDNIQRNEEFLEKYDKLKQTCGNFNKDDFPTLASKIDKLNKKIEAQEKWKTLKERCDKAEEVTDFMTKEGICNEAREISSKRLSILKQELKEKKKAEKIAKEKAEEAERKRQEEIRQAEEAERKKQEAIRLRKEEEERLAKIAEERLEAIKMNCNNCMSAFQWNEERCDPCIDSEEEVYGEDKMFFASRKKELITLQKLIYPKLLEIANKKDAHKFVRDEYSKEAKRDNGAVRYNYDNFTKENAYRMDKFLDSLQDKVDNIFDMREEAISNLNSAAKKQKIQVAVNLKNTPPKVYYFNEQLNKSSYELKDVLKSKKKKEKVPLEIREKCQSFNDNTGEKVKPREKNNCIQDDNCKLERKNNKLRCTTKTVAEIRKLAIKRREEEEQRLSKIAEKRHTKKCLPKRSGSKVDCSKCSVFDAPEGSSFGSDEICAVEEGGMDSDAPGQSRCLVHCKPKVCCKKTGFPPLYMEQCRGQGKEVDLSQCTDESGADKKYFSI